MVCLSNIVVGIYMNTKTLPFSEHLLGISEEGIEFVKNFKDSTNFSYNIDVKFDGEIELREYQM